MIKDQKELTSLLKLCRKQGVTEITLGGVSIKFGDMPQPRLTPDADDLEEQQPELIDTLTSEQLANFTGGM